MNIIGEYHTKSFGIKINIDFLDKFADPEKAGQLFLKAAATTLDQDHIEFIKAQKSQKQKFIAIKLFTVFVHEGRHWIDLASSPFGCYINSQILSAYVNFFSAKDYFQSTPKIICPIKLSDNLDLQEAAPVIAKIYELFDKVDRKLSETTEIEGISWSSTHILEALATLQQELYIKAYLDQDCLEIFQQGVRDEPLYYSLLAYLRTSYRLEDEDIHILLYYSLFGYSSDKSINISPPYLLKLFLKGFNKKKNIVDYCDSCLVDYLHYPAFALSTLATENSKQHLRAMKESLKQHSIWQGELKILVESVGEIIEMGKSVFQLIEKYPSAISQPFAYYHKACWPLVYYEARIGFHFPDELGPTLISYIGYSYENIDKEKILQETPFHERAYLETYLDQLRNTGNVSSLFTFTSENKSYFRLQTIYLDMVYFNLLFNGIESIHENIFSGFQEVYLDKINQVLHSVN